MREALDPGAFVAASYIIALGGSLVLLAWSWLAMLRAEAGRDRSRES